MTIGCLLSWNSLQVKFKIYLTTKFGQGNIILNYLSPFIYQYNTVKLCPNLVKTDWTALMAFQSKVSLYCFEKLVLVDFLKMLNFFVLFSKLINTMLNSDFLFSLTAFHYYIDGLTIISTGKRMHSRKSIFFHLFFFALFISKFLNSIQLLRG